MRFIFIFLCLATAAFAEQKVVLITGASQGIGLATAKAFQEKGWKVWAGYRQNIPAELKGFNLVPLDVTDDRLVQQAIATVLKQEERIDALINNAGYGLIGAEEAVTIKEAQHLFDVNFFGVMRMVQAVLPTMRKQHGGHILNISSGVGVHSFPGLGLYSASKFALEGFSESLAATVSPWNIQVSIIEPGYVKNSWGKHCAIGSRDCQEEFYSKLTKGMCNLLSTPQGQSCEEIAALIVQVAETENPDMRYQTSPEMQESISQRLVDPKGNKAKKLNIRFVNQLTK